MNTAAVGAVCFGIVVGWIIYRTLARRAEAVALSDIATVLGAIGGAAVVGLFDEAGLFGLYAIGLAVGFFGYLLVFWRLNGAEKTAKIMGGGQSPVEIDE
ncbi:hypothetical protein AB0K60_23050 [Thermopolyspora sp. NPDC052614]|uniref:hypothetical protein n=1 Tax=Thermopolyspora sp. NPDC052614 TaxID=3155682 RepID=UPI003415C7B3